MIEVKKLSKKYSNGTHALKDVSFRLDKKITSIIGQNGAGKTTLLRILSTQLLPTSGDATINNYSIIKDDLKIREISVSIPQEARPISWFSALSLVRLYLAGRGMSAKEAKKEAERALKAVGLWESRNVISFKLSGGMKRKIFVAMALGSNADVIFLDEPTTGLDPLSRIQVWSAIRRMRGQVVVTTHYMEEAQALSDDVLMINKGRILAHASVKDLLKPFDGLVRVESRKKLKASHKVGGIWVSYVKKKNAEDYVVEGDVIKPVTLDDLFLKEGVDLES
jgi:ABC-2 type transport system ATP-binding protein